ncbi:hypothetical protein OG735_40900 [Streptomyces sp. NBC_01210]|uniref:hypothetical protein n=1 Tax=Streptomyces sp. NBC_01210 TaxID=2903774 RepID=UPI002E152E75|nr:hypothetical protein OG735_00135 [Streptomyces sp. NBC_01210]WSR03794.1 hypothetical protein OG735_40900 [Streptomyces sp. NBC_01210]
MAGGAYEELSQTGQLGPETFELLRRLVHQVRRSSGFPPPEGYAEWDDDAAYEVITAMLIREGAGQQFVTSCFALAADDASLERLFLTSIKNFLIDEAKKTPRGKLRRRIARLMGADASFRRMPGPPPRWALSEHPEGAVWQGDPDDLVAEAWRVRGVGITRWNHSGPTPAQTVRALMAIVMQVLCHARGAVREEDLAKVLESRFELLSPARFTPLYADDGALAGPVEASAAEADTPGAGGAAADIWQRLTANEHLLLPYLDEDAHHAAQLLEIRQAQAGAVLAGLKAKLLLALSEDNDREAVVGALLRRCADPPPESPL